MEATVYAKSLLKRKKLPEIRPGDIVRVHERVKEGNKTRVAIFEGLVIARRHGSEPGATITVRKISYSVGVERIFPLYAPTVEKFEIIRRAKVRRAKLHYIRERVGKQAVIRGELIPPQTGEAEEEASPEDDAVEAGKEATTEMTAETEGAKEEGKSEYRKPDLAVGVFVRLKNMGT